MPLKRTKSLLGEPLKAKNQKPILLARLQDIVNACARQIDWGQPCIYCQKSDFTKFNPENASHYHSVNSNPSLRFNLHGLHLGHQHCNTKDFKPEYDAGLRGAYSCKYADYVKHDMVAEYPLIDLAEHQIKEHIRMAESVRKELIDMNAPFDADMRIKLRQAANREIGIYKRSNAQY
jgi:hypothetical protein